jgi:hypothetical protein
MASGLGIGKPSQWGPKLWTILHSLGYYSSQLHQDERVPEIIKKDAMREVLWLLGHLETIVPCSECRQHIEEYRKTNGLVNTLEGVEKWTIDFHNAVNVRLGKPVYTEKTIHHQKILLRSVWKEYMADISQPIMMGHLPGDGPLEFARHLFLWKGFVGF